jgi:hypothetical protein
MYVTRKGGPATHFGVMCDISDLQCTTSHHLLASSVHSKPFLNVVPDILRFTKRIGGSSVLLHNTGLGIHCDKLGCSINWASPMTITDRLGSNVRMGCKPTALMF